MRLQNCQNIKKPYSTIGTDPSQLCKALVFSHTWHGEEKPQNEIYAKNLLKLI